MATGVPRVSKEKSGEALKTAVKELTRDALGIPSSFISDQTLTWLCDNSASTQGQTELTLSLANGLLNEKTLLRANRVDDFCSEWLAADREARESGNSSAFAEKTRAYVPVPDANNQANDVAAMSALKRVRKSNILARLASAVRPLGDASLELRIDGDTQAQQELIDALANAVEHAAVIAEGGLRNTPSGAYSVVVHDYVDSLERLVASLTAAAPALEPVTAPPVQRTTIQGQCQFSSLFGIVHSATNTRSKTPRGKRNVIVPNDAFKNDSSDDANRKREALSDSSETELSDIANVDSQLAVNASNQQGRTTIDDAVSAALRWPLWLAGQLIYYSTLIFAVLVTLVEQSAKLFKTDAVGVMKSIKLTYNNLFGREPYDNPLRQASRLEKSLFGYVQYINDAADDTNDVITAVVSTIADVAGSTASTVGSFVGLTTPGLASNLVDQPMSSAALPVTGSVYVPGSFFRMEDSLISRCVTVFGKIARLPIESYPGDVLTDMWNIIVLVALIYIFAKAYKVVAGVIEVPYDFAFGGFARAGRWTADKTGQIIGKLVRFIRRDPGERQLTPYERAVQRQQGQLSNVRSRD